MAGFDFSAIDRQEFSDKDDTLVHLDEGVSLNADAVFHMSRPLFELPDSISEDDMNRSVEAMGMAADSFFKPGERPEVRDHERGFIDPFGDVNDPSTYFEGPVSDDDDSLYSFKSSSLGNFNYDPKEWKIVGTSVDGVETLGIRYIGSETDGSKIDIPYGLKNLDGAFMGTNLVSPVPGDMIPDSVTSMRYTYADCPDMVGFTNEGFDGSSSSHDIPANIVDASYMFDNCPNLEHPYTSLSSDSEMANLTGYTRGCPYVSIDLDITSNASTRTADFDKELKREAERQGAHDELMDSYDYDFSGKYGVEAPDGYAADEAELAALLEEQSDHVSYGTGDIKAERGFADLGEPNFNIMKPEERLKAERLFSEITEDREFSSQFFGSLVDAGVNGKTTPSFDGMTDENREKAERIFNEITEDPGFENRFSRSVIAPVIGKARGTLLEIGIGDGEPDVPRFGQASPYRNLGENAAQGLTDAYSRDINPDSPFLDSDSYLDLPPNERKEIDGLYNTIYGDGRSFGDRFMSMFRGFENVSHSSDNPVETVKIPVDTIHRLPQYQRMSDSDREKADQILDTLNSNPDMTKRFLDIFSESKGFDVPDVADVNSFRRAGVEGYTGNELDDKVGFDLDSIRGSNVIGHVGANDHPGSILSRIGRAGVPGYTGNELDGISGQAGVGEADYGE